MAGSDDRDDELAGFDQAFLRVLGDRVRGERARRGMSRRMLADRAQMSERYIAQIEGGKGNISILLLRQLAAALGLPLGRLLEPEAGSPEMALLVQFLSRLSSDQLKDAHSVLAARFASDAAALRTERIALVGLRGAGKTTLGKALAKERGVPFFELDREIERLSGSSLASIMELYGQQAYRRYELQALEALLARHERFVVATGGGIVSEAANYELLLRHCLTIWVKATPEEHMERVLAQGDLRPMAGSERAMDDLRRILAERTPLYARADSIVDTAGRAVAESVAEMVRESQKSESRRQK